MAELAIEARNLVRSFGDNHAVDGVNLAVPKGEIYGFLGPNGAGKSTTVRVLCTLLSPSSGSASVAGYDVEKVAAEVRVRIGVAPKRQRFDDKQSGREILELQARLFGLSEWTRIERVERSIELADLDYAIDEWVETYSGGMKRRLDLAASLIHDPEILFLDEPTTGLDPVSRVRVWDEVRRLNQKFGVTVFLTTQYLEEADALADRVGIIDQGRIVQEGTPLTSNGAWALTLSSSIDRKFRTSSAAAKALPAVDEVTAGPQGLTISTADGAGLVADVAVVSRQGFRLNR